MSVAAALLDAAARGDAARLTSLLLADPRQIDAVDEVRTNPDLLPERGLSSPGLLGRMQ